ncbi:MAG TPA: TVP38/TMEM64 family protein [Prosthecobacter sp.]|nr:TVP38/TMEM64 family protein [Prosthecobacter sp.]
MNFRQALKRHRRWLVPAVVLAAVVALISFLPVQVWVKNLAGAVERAGHWGALLFIAANGVAAVFLIPGWVFTLTAGLLYGLGSGAAIAHAGSLLGAVLAFLCGRYLVRGRVERLLRNNQKFAAVDQAIGRHGWKIVSLIRLSPIIPFFLQNYLYSVTCIRFWPYFFSTAVCTFPGTLFYVYLGAAGRYSVVGARPDGGPMQWVLMAVGFVATVAGTAYINKVAKRALTESVAKSPSSPAPTPPD